MPNQDTAKYTIAGVAVMVAWGESFQVFGSLNSSPWTARNFGGDKEKAAECMKMVRKGVVNNFLMGGLGSALLYYDGKQRGWWIPFLVTNGISAYMYYEYTSAIKGAQQQGSTGWGSA